MGSTDMQSFSQWCLEKDFVFNDVEIKEAEESSGYGVYAKRCFRPEEKLIIVPDEFMLTGGKVADMEKYSDIADRADPPLTPFEMLTIFFALEDPDNSDWGPYLKILPQSFDTPDYLGIDFEPEHIPIASREDLLKHRAELQQNLFKIEALLPNILRQKVLWAWHIVNTRCVYNENRLHPKLDNSEGDTIIIAPFIDMLNHESTSQCIFLADKSKHEYIVKANSTVREGDQALVTYGPHTNAKLWFIYGFHLPSNIHNKICLPHELLFELAEQIGLPITQENREAVYWGSFPNTIYASDESLSWQFLTNVKILLMSREGAEVFRQHVLNNLDYDKEPEIELRIRVHETSISLLQALKGRLITDKENSPQVVHWIWDEDIQLLDTLLDTTRNELTKLQNGTDDDDDNTEESEVDE